MNCGIGGNSGDDKNGRNDLPINTVSMPEGILPMVDFHFRRSLFGICDS